MAKPLAALLQEVNTAELEVLHGLCLEKMGRIHGSIMVNNGQQWLESSLGSWFVMVNNGYKPYNG